MSVFRSMVRVVTEDQPHTLSLPDELRLTALEPKVDQDILHRDISDCIAVCFAAASQFLHECTYSPIQPGWCGFVGPSWAEHLGGVARRFRVYKDVVEAEIWGLCALASDEARVRGGVQLHALARELRLRGLRVTERDGIILHISWKKRWWERLFGRWL